MNRTALRSAIVAFVDDQDNAGLEVESDELLDVARELEDHPRDEAELGLVVFEVVSSLLEDGVLTAYTKNGATGNHVPGVLPPVPPVYLCMAPKPVEDA